MANNYSTWNNSVNGAYILSSDSLLAKGFDVWNRTVVTNWGVVALFLVLFVGGLGVVGWLISVVVRAQKPMEGATL